MTGPEPKPSALRVTFDTSTIAGVVDPEGEEGLDARDAYRAAHAAIRDGRVRGFFSEAMVTLDAIGRKDKAEVLGAARFVSETTASGPSGITITIGPRWKRTNINPRILARIAMARALGMRALIGPRRFGDSLVVQGFGEDFYEPYPLGAAFVAAADAANGLDLAIVRRGLGRAQVIELAKGLSERSGVAGEWWPQGLGRTVSAAERKKVRSAVNEWADGEALAAHAGYANDLFCTNDHAAGHGDRSVLHPTHRSWLSERGVSVVTVSQLAARLEGLA
jgi:hypothetical protein